MTKGIERAAALYGGSKAAGALAPAAGGLVQAGQGAYGVGKSLFGMATAGGAAASGAAGVAAAAPASAAASGAASFFGGSGVTAGVGTTAAEASAMGAAMGVGGGAEGAAGAATAASSTALATALASVALAASVAVASIVAVKEDALGVFGWLQNKFEDAAGAARPAMRALERLGASLGKLWEASKPLVAVLGTIPMAPFVFTLMQLADAVTTLAPIVEAMANGLTKVADEATKLMTVMDGWITKIHKLLHLDEKAPPPAAPAPWEWGDNRQAPRKVDMPDPVAVAKVMAANNGPKTVTAPKGKGGSKVEVVLKWDLGDGNDEAIYVRSRRQIVEMTKAARGSLRSSRIPGM